MEKDMPTIYIPTPMRKFSNHKAQVKLQLAPEGTLTELLLNLEESCPGIKGDICDATGVIRRYVNIFVNGHEIRCLNGVNTIIEGKDEIFIIPAMAGG